MLLFFLGFKSQAQCDIALSNVVVQIVGSPIVLGANKCQVTVNVQFDLDYNAGSKYVYFHSWLGPDYPNPPFFTCGGSTPAVDPPTSLQLGTVVDEIGKSFLDVGLDNSSGHGAVGVPVNVTILTTYNPDPTVVLTQPSNSPGMTVTKTLLTAGGHIDHFIAQNVKVIFNQSCSSTIIVKTDAWASNSSAANSKAQCYICGSTQYYNDPTVTGFKNCNNPRQYAINISTVNPTLQTITYKLYLDKDGNGTLSAGDILAYSSSGNETIQISSSQSFSSGLRTYLPYAGQKPDADYDLLILVEGATLPNSILYAVPNPGCAPLPVNFVYFNARRTSSTNVSLTWETATEVNNNGFEILRLMPNGDWETIGFIRSTATDGNSTSAIDYSFNDNNPSKGITQYRIRQVDLNGKYTFTDIRAVRGDGQPGKTIIYPNPSADGTVNVVFDDVNAVRDVALVNANGQLIRKWDGIANNNLKIVNITPGFYTVLITIHDTGERSVEKFVVYKR